MGQRNMKVLGAKPNPASYADFSGKSLPFCIPNLTCSGNMELTCKAGMEPGASSDLALLGGDPSTLENSGKGSGVMASAFCFAVRSHACS